MPFISSTSANYSFGRNAVSNYGLFDPYFGYVSLLLHMNGVSGSTNFIDSSPSPKVITSFGGAQLSSTSPPKFGSTSAFFNNIDAYLTTPDDPGFNFVTGDWTVELFCNIFPVEADILINKAVGLGLFPFQLRVINSRFNARGYNTSAIPSLVYNLGFSTGPVITPGIWYHVAMARQGNNFYLYVNGVLVDSATSSSNLYSSIGSVSLGGTSDGRGLVSGYFDEVRITKGICRYPNGISFSVPSAEFPNS